NLYVAIRFWRTAKAEGLAPILGVDLGEDGRAGAARGAAAPERGVVRAAPSTPTGAPPARALLVAIDRRGYSNLCALITARKLDPCFDLVGALAERHAGLHVIVESTGLAASLLTAGVPAAFGDHGPRPRDGGLWIGVRGIPVERSRLAARLDAARSLGVPPVATGDVVMLDAQDHDVHAIAVTAAAGELRERMPASAFAVKEAWLAPPLEWVRRVRAVCAAAG